MIKKYSQLDKTYWHITPEENVNSILENGLIPQIGARSRNADEPVPAIYLFGSKEEAEDAAMNWLGDEFEETEEENLALLQVKIPTNIEVKKEAFEYQVFEPIPAENIKVIKTF